MKILLLGEHGQVSRELQLCLAGQAELIVRGREQLDLADPQQIRQQVRALRPELIINAAAHTAVDLAESEPERAFAINATAPGILAEEAADLGVPLLHYSTDYVFDGRKAAPYTEDDMPNPLGVYGRSKLAGEQAIQAVGGAHLILRTSWVYSLHGRNFLLTMQRLLQERDELKVVSDQIGAPTWAGSIAAVTAELIGHWRAGQAGPWGTCHLTARGQTSWFGFASAIAEQLRAQGKPVARLEAIPSGAYPTPAQRPLNSRLDCTRLQRDWQIQLPDWHDALLECLASPRRGLQ
ncbi:dTDP-4-dehydrorhamnose reductase [Pseudomonas lalucatii]|uniref:dTDP-4-dehydrorhamnose reductase n=1 Tax=Pseudomonas lalucatii TaxID=1424203 RepID=A0ABS5Q1M4_9PSED|nr:dTDP-4-dehydrorhamnose reductase [Pseudomonas lalucatii]MBS7662398.1 dTDP-4-dehydrorhamnose reductase [Pseudomonas lalucatii]MBS7725945.1 dTDP-4-dehydrorhamnose reductase [Pseudomonas lalucatii]QVM88468.1 dTDP-4-dehydrorhamnose reductase [Pseudomonas lalucatii]